MKCFKHLGAKWILSFVLFSGWGFALRVSAAEIAITPETTSATIDTNVTEDTNAELAALMQALLLAREQDVDRLSRLIQTESGKGFEDKVGVGLTALYRTSSPNFPNTVEENINMPSQYAKPAKGEVLPENLMAAEYAMELWESGACYAVLPAEYMYFVGNGKENKFHDFNGHYLRASEIRLDLVTPYIQGPDGALIS